MPLLLTTPITTGDLESFDYDRIQIIEEKTWPTRNMSEFVVEYGTVQASEWVSGKFQPSGFPKKYTIKDADEALDADGTPITGTDSTEWTDVVLAALPTDGNEKLYDGAARVLYQWLIDNGHFTGTIE